MKKNLILTLLALTGSVVMEAQTHARLDSSRVEQLAEVLVSGVRTQKNAPYAVANIKKKELQQFSTTGRELPFLFARTPGVMAWSENGLGTGTTYMRIRGAGDSRINVTIDGVPLNSPEDQCVFWANMNSYASLLGSVQIQRGVGTSTNGDGAFGGTVALQTAAPQQQAGGELSASYGSYNTMNVGGRFSTGLLWQHLIFDGAYHETQTDGFIHGTSGRSGSYYGGLTWTDERLQLRYKNIGNFEKTGQAWNGVTAGNNDLSLMDGMSDGATGVKTYRDLCNVELGQYNTLYEDLDYNADGSLKKEGGAYATRRYEMADGSYWPKATDNYWQNHNLLSAAFDLGQHWNASATLHYTHGYGYYNEFRPGNKLGKKFGITFYDAAGNYVKKSDVVRKKGLKQDAYGMVGNLNYQDKRWDIVGGLSLQRYEGNHFGYITYIRHAEASARLLAQGDYQYYDSDAKKLDGSGFLKAAYRLSGQWQVFADMQFRHVDYQTDGLNDKFIEQADGTWKNQELDVDNHYNFLNPKLGVSYSDGPHHAYASAAVSHREPERNNYTDNGSYPAPEAEQLLDFEAGYSYSSRTVRAGLNAYYMKYDNQFVQTGAYSDIGEKLTTNIKDSYRMGVELSASWDVLPWLALEGNAALSQNKIKDFNEQVETYDEYWSSLPATEIHYDHSTLAYSPSAILNGFVDLHYGGFNATWHTNYVSRQYLDNTECRDRSLPAYSFSNLSLSYTAKVEKVAPLREIVVGLTFNNLFNARYATSAWVYSSIVRGSYTADNRYYQIGFMPMAGTTAMAHLTLRF